MPYIIIKSAIYTITNILDGKMYIGYTNNLYKRWSQHIRHLRNNIHNNTYLQAAYNKYGKENFLYEILVECDERFLNSEEHYWVNILKTYDKKKGYNIKPTNPNTIGGHSEETKLKLSKARKEYTKNNNHLLGHKCTEETKEKLRKANKGRVFSEERNLKISESHKGKKRPKELMKKIGEKNIGSKRTDEQKMNMSNKQLEICRKRMRVIIELDNKGNIIKEWEGARFISEVYNISTEMIHWGCKQNKVSKGYIFKYK